MSATQHIKFCKERALEYLDQGNVAMAFTSFSSDMANDDETREIFSLLMPVGMQAAMTNDEKEMRRFIEGFN